MLFSVLCSPAQADRARSGLEKQKTGTVCGDPGPAKVVSAPSNCLQANILYRRKHPKATPPQAIDYPQPECLDHFSGMSGRAFAGSSGLCEPQKSVSGLRTGQTINARKTESSRGLEGQRVGYDKSQSGLYALKLTPRYRAPSRQGCGKRSMEE